jgi:hypothetical protein
MITMIKERLHSRLSMYVVLSGDTQPGERPYLGGICAVKCYYTYRVCLAPSPFWNGLGGVTYALVPRSKPTPIAVGTWRNPSLGRVHVVVHEKSSTPRSELGFRVSNT